MTRELKTGNGILKKDRFEETIWGNLVLSVRNRILIETMLGDKPPPGLNKFETGSPFLFVTIFIIS